MRGRQGGFILNPFRFAAAGPAVTWNPADKSSNISLSNGDRTAACSTAAQSLVRATTARSTGKYYFEVVADSVAASGTLGYVIGVAAAAVATNVYVGSTATSVGWRRSGGYLMNGSSTGSDTYVTGDIIGIAIDFATRGVWFAKNGVWQSTGNPAAGTGANRTYPNPTTMIPAMSFNNATVQQGTGRFKLADFSYAPPSGFSAWE